MMSAAASLGLSLLWDTDVGLSHVDKYTYSSEEHIKVNFVLTIFRGSAYSLSLGWGTLCYRAPEHWCPDRS
jgi:hypothetical protein